MPALDWSPHPGTERKRVLGTALATEFAQLHALEGRGGADLRTLSLKPTLIPFCTVDQKWEMDTRCVVERLSLKEGVQAGAVRGCH